MNENSIIKDIGRSYIVSSFLPAILFVSVGILVFRGFVPEIVTIRVGEKNVVYASQFFLFFAFASWLAFGLYSVADTTIRLFEGYYFPAWLAGQLVKPIISKHRKMKENIQPVLNIVGSDQIGDMSDEEIVDYSFQLEKAKYDYLKLETIFPVEEEALLPTRLGNIMRAAELYPAEKYAVPGVMLWPRLLQLLPKDLKDQLEEKNNQMVFTLNSSLLSYMLGTLSILAGLVRLLFNFFESFTVHRTAIASNFFDRGFANISPVEYIYIGLFFLATGYIAYALSIPIVENFGLLVRASYDLYRFELLRKLNHPIPPSIQMEKNFWKKISEYMIAGDNLALVPLEINYSVRKELYDYKIPTKRKKTRKKKIQQYANLQLEQQKQS